MRCPRRERVIGRVGFSKIKEAVGGKHAVCWEMGNVRTTLENGLQICTPHGELWRQIFSEVSRWLCIV